MPTDEHYAHALNELLTQQFDQGLFARCFALAEGDESRTKAKYIELRAQAIHDAEIEFAIASARQQKIQDQILAAETERRKQNDIKEKIRADKQRKESLKAERIAQKQREDLEREQALELERMAFIKLRDPLSYEAFAEEYRGKLAGLGLFKRRELWLSWLDEKSK